MSMAAKRRDRKNRIEQRHHELGDYESFRPNRRIVNLDNKMARLAGEYEQKPFGNQPSWCAKACVIILYYIILYYIISYYIKQPFPILG